MIKIQIIIQKWIKVNCFQLVFWGYAEVERKFNSAFFLFILPKIKKEQKPLLSCYLLSVFSFVLCFCYLSTCSRSYNYDDPMQKVRNTPPYSSSESDDFPTAEAILVSTLSFKSPTYSEAFSTTSSSLSSAATHTDC